MNLRLRQARHTTDGYEQNSIPNPLQEYYSVYPMSRVNKGIKLYTLVLGGSPTV
jgi:hypothetical protein